MAAISGLKSFKKDDFIEINEDSSELDLNNLAYKVNEKVNERLNNLGFQFVDYEGFIVDYIGKAKNNLDQINIKEFSNVLIQLVELVAKNNFSTKNITLESNESKNRISNVIFNGSVELFIDYQALIVQFKFSDVIDLTDIN
jgi:ethanolamine utilization protein EutA (predicted chaperonin)